MSSGATIALPDDHKGFVLQRAAAADSDSCEESMSQDIPSWSTTGTFDEVSYWNHDTPVSSMDTAPRAFEWLSVVSAVSNSPSMFTHHPLWHPA